MVEYIMPAKNLLAKIHIRKKELGLDEETYRQALQAVTGKRSAGEMNNIEIIRCLRHFDGKKPDVYAASPEIQWKVKQLWHEIYRGNNELLHLRQWLFNKFRVSDVEFLDKHKAWQAVEALKNMRQRKDQIHESE
jgi:phage gp16-like protein